MGAMNFMDHTRSNFLHIALFLSIAGMITSCTLMRIVIYQYDDLRDYRKFPCRHLSSDSVKFTFQKIENGYVPAGFKSGNNEPVSFGDFLESKETIAFLIIRRDTIIYESYFDGYEETYLIPAYSMAKSFLSILTGCAIDDGLIQSVADPLTKYLPELKDNGLDEVKIEHLLQMTSGIKNNEDHKYYMGNLYYGRNAWKIISDLDLEKKPGTEFCYLNVNAELLGFVLERALNGKTVTQYMEEKIWQPLGMEYDASWSLDRKKNGMEKTFCCINACARDYAKIGRLFLEKGKWNGRQIVSGEWVEKSVRPDTTNGSVSYYHYMWWLPSPNGDYLAAGRKGQFVYVNPSKNLIIVRLGKDFGDVEWHDLFIELAANY